MAEAPHATRDYASACTRVGGFDVTYLSAGEGPEPVVLLHGFGAWSEVVWGRTLPALADRYRVFAPDLVGFGLSSKPTRIFFSLDPLKPEIDFLAEFLDALGIERCALIGHSFGAGLALRFTLDFPHRVSKVVAVSSMGLGRSIHPVYKALATPYLGEMIVRPSRARLRQMWQLLVKDPALVTDAVVERNFELLSEPGAAEVLTAARYGINFVGQKILLEDALWRIQQPCLVVWGKNDRVFPVRHARRAVRRLPSGELVLLDCGHIPPFETPEEFNAAVRRFLDGDAGPSAKGTEIEGDAAATG